ncbi:MAG: diacylglycerol kinase family protein [Myxococcaceae bacterium]|nr:diacylglycerol kinase family protein [Myxococcaceae bacterium]
MKRARKVKRLSIPPYPRLGRPGFIGSAFHAWNGLIHTVVHQRNMRVHVLAAFAVSLVGSGIPLGLAEKVTLIFCVLLVFFAEILNSALEQLVDLATQEFDEKAKIAKDAAAAGVLVLAIGTVVIFAAIIFHNRDTIVAFQMAVWRQMALGFPLMGTAGLLMMKRRRPKWVDAVVFFIACVLLAFISRNSTSAVFTSMTAGLIVITGAAAWERHRLWAET